MLYLICPFIDSQIREKTKKVSVKVIGTASGSTIVLRRLYLFLWLKINQFIMDKQKNKNQNYFDLFATRLAEIRLSEKGFPFIPGIYAVIKRIRQYVECKALIINFQK